MPDEDPAVLALEAGALQGGALLEGMLATGAPTAPPMAFAVFIPEGTAPMSMMLVQPPSGATPMMVQVPPPAVDDPIWAQVRRDTMKLRSFLKYYQRVY